jgi:hypothetical protein
MGRIEKRAMMRVLSSCRGEVQAAAERPEDPRLRREEHYREQDERYGTGEQLVQAGQVETYREAAVLAFLEGGTCCCLYKKPKRQRFVSKIKVVTLKTAEI